MKNLFLLLLAYLALGATGEGEGGGADDGAAAALPEGGEEGEQGTGDETLDDLIGLAETDLDAAGGEDADPKEGKAIKEARLRAQTAEANLAAERAARAAAEARAAPPQQYRDPDIERENAEYQQAVTSGASPEQLKLIAWQIESNRTLRNTQRSAYGALAQAQDLQDKAQFDRLEITRPKMYKMFAPRVEAAMAEMRSRGTTAPRLAVLRLLLGDDMMNGKVIPKKRAAGDSGTVDRGRTTGARGDVGNKGKLTEHQKRTARLENQRI